MFDLNMTIVDRILLNLHFCISAFITLKSVF